MFLYIFVYRCFLVLLFYVGRILALFNTKARKWYKGQQHVFREIEILDTTAKRPVWFHFSSVGEFEQGYPLLQKLAAKGDALVATFFSPSAEILKAKITETDKVFYLPVDRPHNVRRFLDKVQPKMAIFTRYEYWFEYFNQLKKRDIPLIYINFFLQEKNTYLRYYRTWFRFVLNKVSYFFCVDKNTFTLLDKLHFNNKAMSGDTRWERVLQLSEQSFSDSLIEGFCSQSNVFIAGSVWQTDIELLGKVYPCLQKLGYKLIIAPHEISDKNIEQISRTFEHVAAYTSQDIRAEHNVLMVDTVGILSRLYRYGKVAYVGGGFDDDIHNIQEPAAYKLPVLFGTNHYKYPEAKELIDLGCAFSIKNEKDFCAVLKQLDGKKIEQVLEKYLKDKRGVVEAIVGHPIFKTLDL